MTSSAILDSLNSLAAGSSQMDFGGLGQLDGMKFVDTHR